MAAPNCGEASSYPKEGWCKVGTKVCLGHREGTMDEGKTAESGAAPTGTAAPRGKCAIRELLHRIGDAWSVLVIERLDESPDPVRFNELRRRVGDISQRMLTVTLRNLER